MSAGITDDAANLKADMYNYMGDHPDRWPVRYSVAADLGMKAGLVGIFINDQVQNVAVTQSEARDHFAGF